MKIKFKYSLLCATIFIVALNFNSCKKYPQDGKLSFETPDKRLRRVWILTECLVDGVDVTDKEYMLLFNSTTTTKDTTIYKLKDATLEFKYYKTRNNPQHELEKNHESYLSIKTIMKHLYAVPSSISDYEFKNNHKFIKFNTNISSSEKFPLLFNDSNELWTIKELIKTKFIIETTNSSGNKIKVTFKSQ